MYLFKLKKGNIVLSITAFVDFFVVFTDWRLEKKESTLGPKIEQKSLKNCLKIWHFIANEAPN